MSQFGTKKALFGCFWAIIKKKILSYLKSVPRICLIAKFSKETKTQTVNFVIESAFSKGLSPGSGLFIKNAL